MKKTSTLLIAFSLLLTSFVFGQSPEGVNYQAVVRNSSGTLLTNQSVTVIFAIRSVSTSGTVVYQETQTKTTNAYGGFSAVIGKGTATTGTFSSINWGASSHFLNVKVNGNDLGTTQMMSVPYALHSKTSDNVKNSIWKKRASNGDYYAVGEPVIIGDSSASAAGLTVYSATSPSFSELIDLRVDTINTGADFINMYTNSPGTKAAQFIECSNVGTKFRVNTDGSVYANKQIKTDSSLIVADEINRVATGNANMIPVAYGVVQPSGVLFPNASTGNYTCAKISTGVYEIQVTGVSLNFTTNPVLLTRIFNGFIYYNSVAGGKIRVYTSNTSGTAADAYFSFTIHQL